jgi:hypothetical protein
MGTNWNPVHGPEQAPLPLSVWPATSSSYSVMVRPCCAEALGASR